MSTFKIYVNHFLEKSPLNITFSENVGMYFENIPLIYYPCTAPPATKVPCAINPRAAYPCVKPPIVKIPYETSPIAKTPYANTPTANSPSATKPVEKTPLERAPCAISPLSYKLNPEPSLFRSKTPTISFLLISYRLTART